jgi:hypothetical protein
VGWPDSSRTSRQAARTAALVFPSIPILSLTLIKTGDSDHQIIKQVELTWIFRTKDWMN